MRTLGIDPGTLTTGYGVVETLSNGGLKCVCAGIVKAPASMPLPQRLLRITRAIEAVIKEHSPDCAALESAFVGKNVRSALHIGHARGAAMLIAAASGLTVSEYAPKAVKLAVTGYGGASKDQVQYMIKAMLGLKSVPYADASDALAVAVCHLNTSRLASATRLGSVKARGTASLRVKPL